MYPKTKCIQNYWTALIVYFLLENFIYTDFSKIYIFNKKTVERKRNRASEGDRERDLPQAESRITER